MEKPEPSADRLFRHTAFKRTFTSKAEPFLDLEYEPGKPFRFAALGFKKEELLAISASWDITIQKTQWGEAGLEIWLTAKDSLFMGNLRLSTEKEDFNINFKPPPPCYELEFAGTRSAPGDSLLHFDKYVARVRNHLFVGDRAKPQVAIGSEMLLNEEIFACSAFGSAIITAEETPRVLYVSLFG